MFFKTINGAHGEGALSVNSKDGTAYSQSGEKISLQDILTHCFSYDCAFLIQECLTPNRALKSLMPGRGLGTFRVLTLLQKDKNSVKILYALAKIPVGGNIIDNFKHGESGNLLCGIDVANGKLLSVWGQLSDEQNISRIERHPDTHLLFEEFFIPKWNEIIDLVSRAALAFSELTTLGWDVAITDKGLCILETNDRYDIDLHQIALNRGLNSEFIDLCARVTAQANFSPKS